MISSGPLASSDNASIADQIEVASSSSPPVAEAIVIVRQATWCVGTSRQLCRQSVLESS